MARKNQRERTKDKKLRKKADKQLKRQFKTEQAQNLKTGDIVVVDFNRAVRGFVGDHNKRPALVHGTFQRNGKIIALDLVNLTTQEDPRFLIPMSRTDSGTIRHSDPGNRIILQDLDQGFLGNTKETLNKKQMMQQVSACAYCLMNIGTKISDQSHIYSPALLNDPDVTYTGPTLPLPQHAIKDRTWDEALTSQNPQLWYPNTKTGWMQRELPDGWSDLDILHCVAQALWIIKQGGINMQDYPPYESWMPLEAYPTDLAFPDFSDIAPKPHLNNPYDLTDRSPA